MKKGALTEGTGWKKFVSGQLLQMLASKLAIYLWSVISWVPLTSGNGPKSPLARIQAGIAVVERGGVSCPD